MSLVKVMIRTKETILVVLILTPTRDFTMANGVIIIMTTATTTTTTKTITTTTTTSTTTIIIKIVTK